MVALTLIKLLVPAILILLGLGETYVYLRVKRKWDRLIVVAAQIVESKLLNRHDVDGRRIYRAQIRIKYRYQGAEYEVDDPILRSAHLFPMWSFESNLVKKYRPGELVNARLLPAAPQVAFLELSEFDWRAAALVPLGVLLYVGLVAATGAFWIAI